MDDNDDNFNEGELFEEIVTVDETVGSSHDFDGALKGPDKHSRRYPKQDPADDDDDYEEVAFQAQIIQGEDGEYYVVMDDDGDPVEVDDDPDNVEVMITPDGEQQFIFQCNPVNPHSHSKRTRPARAILQDTEAGPVEMIQFTDMAEDEHGGTQLDLAVGAIQTAEAIDDHILHHGMVMDGGPMPKGLKQRRARVYGGARCNECGQSFVNTARLERHLAVHQVFGSFLCPLCGKTYKYEYNLFYHWRRTCRDLNELMSHDDRKTMDVNALRSLVDEVAAKKQEYGPVEIGISRSVLFQSGPLARLEMPSNPLGRRGTTCRACGVVVHLMHLAHHLNLHKGLMGVEPDQKSQVGGHYCDLCGLLFRQHFNLIKHWRTNCAEIQANLPENVDITLDDNGLKEMVRELLKRASTNDAILDAESQRVKINRMDGRRHGGSDNVDVGGGYDLPDEEMSEARRERERDEAEAGGEDGGRLFGGGPRPDFADEEPGAVFADDFEDDEIQMLGEEAIGAGGTMANRAKWNMAGGPVQCHECYRSFANPGRLERHMAGFHASHGSHHCALCGNRFKYDYNLLYHYRKSCPYTKNFIERDVRDQMDAPSLRKLVRTLALKDLRLQPVTNPMRRLPKQMTMQSNDALIRREILRPILASSPQVLTQARRGMQNSAKPCPICNIIFYQESAIQRHMNMRHGMTYAVEEYNEEDEGMQQYEEVIPAQRHSGAPKAVPKKAGAAPTNGDEAVEDDEPPPTLEMQPPGEQAVIKEPPTRTRFDSASLEDEHEPHHQLHHAPPHMRDVQEMYERGELQDGDRIIIQEGGREVEYTVNDETLEMDAEEVERDEEEEEADEYGEEQKRMSMTRGSRMPPHQQRRFPAAGEQQQRPSTSGASSARKRPREEEQSVWDDDLLEDDEELEDLQREVNRRRAEDAGRGGPSGRGRQMPSIMQRRGI